MCFRFNITLLFIRQLTSDLPLQIVRAKERIDSEVENIQQNNVKEETKKGNDT